MCLDLVLKAFREEREGHAMKRPKTKGIGTNSGIYGTRNLEAESMTDTPCMQSLQQIAFDLIWLKGS